MSDVSSEVIHKLPLDDGLVVQVRGDIDLSRSPEFRQALIRVLQDHPSRLVIDLTNVPFMDSSGVATLVEALRKQREQKGKLILCNLHPRVRSVFQVSRLDSLFVIVDDIKAAIAH